MFYKTISFIIPKNLMPIGTLFLLLCITFSCARLGSSDKDMPDRRHRDPVVVNLDTIEGYTINIATGDSIKPITVDDIDTIISGKTYVFIEEDITDQVEQTTGTFDPNNVKKEKVQSNIVSDITFKEIEIKVLPSRLDSLALNSGDQTIGPLKTGTPLIIDGVVLKKTEEPPVLAVPARFKDVATENFQYLDVDQGLPSSYVFDQYIDSKGNLWFATYEGVSVFDGISFTNYSIDHGLSGNEVWAIAEDNNGEIWFGTLGGGITRYNGDQFIQYFGDNTLNTGKISDILVDSRGNIWFITNGAGAIKYDGTHFTFYTENEGLLYNYLLKAEEDKDGNIWFSTNGMGVSVFDGKSFQHYNNEVGVNLDYVWSILRDKKGNIWLGTHRNSIIKFDGEQFWQLLRNGESISEIILSIAEEDDGNIWFGTFGDGIFKYDGKTFKNYSEKDGISSNDIMSVIGDRKGNLWLGTNGGGITRFNKKSFTHFTKDNGLTANITVGIVKDSEENIWIGSRGDGVLKYDGVNFEKYAEDEGLEGNAFFAIMEDSKQNMWFGSYNFGGITKLTDHSFVNYNIPDFGMVRTIIEDSEGDIWVCSESYGVVKYSNGSFFRYGFEQKTGSKGIWSAITDQAGNVWFGTAGGGVVKYDGISFINYTTKEGLLSNTIHTMFLDSDGDIWIGSDKGVSEFNGISFSHYTTNEGLSDNMVWSIVEDHDQNIWLGTQSGISVLSGKKESHEILISTYGKLDGLKGLDFYENCAAIDQKGNIWWGTGKGVTTFNSNSFSVDRFAPEVTLNRVEVNGQFIDYNNLDSDLWSDISFDSVHSFTNVPEQLELPHVKNHLTFFFCVKDWSVSHKVMYTHKIEGLDKGWSEPSRELKADYRNLPYGAHTFKVCAVVEGGEWSEPFSFTFKVNPPLWLTWWAITLYVFIFVSILTVFYRLRTKRLKYQKEYLREAVNKATLEIKKQKEELKQTLISNEEKETIIKEIHHRVKNNLQIVNSLIRLQTDFMDKSNFRQKLKETEDRIHSMRLIHEMLYKSEKLANLNVRDYIGELKNNIVEANHSSAKIAFVIEVEAMELGMDTLISLGLIINEIFSNSLKHAFSDQSDGKVSLQLFSDNGKIHINISDNGVGSDIPAKTLCDNSLGMDLIWSLADQLDAELKVETHGGFRYQFVMPY